MMTLKRTLTGLLTITAGATLMGCGAENSANSQDFTAAAAERGYDCAETVPLETGVEIKMTCIHSELGELALSTFESAEMREAHAQELEYEYTVLVADTSAVTGDDETTVEEVAETL